MSEAFVHRFVWSAAKAEAYRRKHGVLFEQAATVFRDPLAISLYDEEHSEDEERWVMLGLAEDGVLLVVVHTVDELDERQHLVRIISARHATAHERQQYHSD